METSFADKYLSQGKSFPTATPFLMPGLGVIKKAQPPTLEQVNESCALAFRDSLSQVARMGGAKAEPRFVQLLFAQAFMVGKDLHCLCVIQWALEPAAKSDSPKKQAKPPAGAGKSRSGARSPKPASKPRRHT